MNNKNNNFCNYIPFLKTDIYKDSTDAEFISNLNKDLDKTVLGDDFSNATESSYENPKPKENLKNVLVDSLELTKTGKKDLEKTSTSKSKIALSSISTLSDKLR